MNASISFGSAYSFPDLIDYDHIECIIGELKKSIESFNFSKNNEIEFSIDLFEFKINGASLEDRLLKATSDFMVAITFLNEIEKIIGKNKSSYRDTPTMQEEIASQNFNEMPYKYTYAQGGTWIPISRKFEVACYSDVCNLNSENFKVGVIDIISFVKKAKKVYEHIEFHKDISGTLKKIKYGTIINYIGVFSHALNTLNQAYHKISKDPTKNEEDLILISAISGTLGHTLACSREAKNKHHFEFPKDGSPTESENINCEYHLKINFDDSGIKLSSQNFNRAYFGLKWSTQKNRKEIKLAHLGPHL